MTRPGWQPAETYPPWVLRRQTGCPVEAAVPVPPGRAAQSMAAVRATAPETAPSVRRTLSLRRRSQQRLRGGIQQDRFSNARLFSRSCQTQRGQGQFVDLAENAFGGLIKSLSRGVIKQRLGHAGGLELLCEISVEFFARKPFEVILHGDALTQWFMQLQREGAAQQRLAHQQQGQIAAGIHVEVQQQGKLFERGMAQQLGFVADENGMLLLTLIEAHDGLGDLAHQIAAVVRRFEFRPQKLSILWIRYWRRTRSGDLWSDRDSKTQR